MKNFLYSLVILSLSAFPAFAQEEMKNQVDPKLCQQMVAHKPAPGVAYEPGVDVHGKPVVEADLNPSPLQAPDKVVFLVSVDMAQYLGLPVPAGTETFGTIGAISHENGVLAFNGEPLDGPAAASLRELCGIKTAPEKQQKAKKIKHNKD